MTMETMFYDEPSLLSSTRKPPMGLDNSSLKLNFCGADGKNLDIAARRDELGFGELADFLISPDIGISSPDLENLVWKEWSSTLKTPASLPEQQSVKQENCEDEAVTKEQEVFAFGFTEALKKLQETERQEIEVNHEETTGDSSECSDSGSHEDSFEPENCDTKITFISYTFDSNERLPSFQEAFSKIIIKKSKESEICFQIKMEASENGALAEQQSDDHSNEEDKEFQKWNTNCIEKDVWDRVETVDEGFCSREAMSVDLDEHSYLEVPGISNECAINQPLNWEHSSDFNINNGDFFKEKSAVDQHLLSDFRTDQYNDENYIENMGSI